MLSDLQQRVARLLLSRSPDPELALAGGAALISRGVVDRPTIDLDFFTTEPRVEDRLEAIVAILRDEGLDVRLEQVGATFARFTVSDSSDGCRVDIAQDYRMAPAEAGPLGQTLTIEELAADKTLALFTRAEARDFIDVYFLARRLGQERLCELAAEKDPGFDERVFADMLGSVGRLDREEFDVDDATYEELSAFIEDWRRALTS